MNKKIVFIVANNAKSGLKKICSKCTNNVFIERYFYTTRKDGDAINFDMPILSKAKPFLFIFEDKIIDTVTKLTNDVWNEEWNFLLISDGIDADNYLHFLDQQCIVIYHGTPVNMEKKLALTNCFASKKGIHETMNDNYYQISFLAQAFNEKDKKFNLIIYNGIIETIHKWFGINPHLEDILNLLHTCTTASGAGKMVNSPAAIKLGVSDDLKTISQINDSGSPKFLKALTELRDKLLP